MSNVCFGFKATPFLCQCTFLYCFCLSLKRPKWRICLSAVALLLLFRLRLLKLLHRCTPDRWVCSKRSTLQVPSWGTVSFPSHPKPAHWSQFGRSVYWFQFPFPQSIGQEGSYRGFAWLFWVLWTVQALQIHTTSSTCQWTQKTVPRLAMLGLRLASALLRAFFISII